MIIIYIFIALLIFSLSCYLIASIISSFITEHKGKEDDENLTEEISIWIMKGTITVLVVGVLCYWILDAIY